MLINDSNHRSHCSPAGPKRRICRYPPRASHAALLACQIAAPYLDSQHAVCSKWRADREYLSWCSERCKNKSGQAWRNTRHQINTRSPIKAMLFRITLAQQTCLPIHPRCSPVSPKLCVTASELRPYLLGSVSSQLVSANIGLLESLSAGES
jgi:hypothetical protein